MSAVMKSAEALLEFRGFHFPSESAALSDAQYARACEIIDAIERVRALGGDALAAPACGWESDPSAVYNELDGTVQDWRTSYALLASKDRDVIARMRLYTQTFSGYQLATMRLTQRGMPWVRRKVPDNHDELLRMLVGPMDKYALMWAALARALPADLRLSLPAVFGETGWRYDDHVVNHDSHAYLTYVAMLQDLKALEMLRNVSHVPRVLEIGAGFGGLAWMLMTLRPDTRYVIVDLPESLAFSAVYLSTLFPALPVHVMRENSFYRVPDAPGITFVPTTLLSRLQYYNIDLAVNTMSMGEMSVAQVSQYCRFIIENLRRNAGVFFEHNVDYSHATEERLGDTLARYFSHCNTSKEFPVYLSARLWANIT
jgi:hypothetical protein